MTNSAILSVKRCIKCGKIFTGKSDLCGFCRVGV